jgi:hypothetical protein
MIFDRDRGGKPTRPRSVIALPGADRRERPIRGLTVELTPVHGPRPRSVGGSGLMRSGVWTGPVRSGNNAESTRRLNIFYDSEVVQHDA